jgi:hypothetical protein
MNSRIANCQFPIANWKATQSAIGNWQLAILFSLVALTLGDRIAFAEGDSSDNDVVMRAMVDELDRSVKDLVLSDLSRP